MASDAISRMQARAQQVRTRAQVQRWQYRQRHLASGVWFRVRLTLARARRAYEISDDNVQTLLGRGYAVEPAGLELAPAKQLMFIDEADLATLPSARSIRVGLGADFMAARAIALVRL